MSSEIGKLARYRCEPGVRGINFEKIGITHGILRPYQTESNNFTRVGISKVCVEVFEPGARQYEATGRHMLAFVRDGVYCPEVVTENKEGRHPDFFGREFIEATLDFFSANGLSLHSWESWWPWGTRNADQFLIDLNERTDDDSICHAIQSTWSYAVASKNKFRTVEKPTINNDGIGVIFRR
jgi:hypothetical protein